MGEINKARGGDNYSSPLSCSSKRVVSETTRKNISRSLSGRRLSEQHKANLSKAMKGKISSPETIFKKGQQPPYHHNHTKGEKHWNWQGGISPISRRLRRSREWNEWRRDVFKRDNYTCQECGAREVELHPHHKIPQSINKDLIFEVDNGITLCVECHLYSGKYHKEVKRRRKC